MYEKVHTFTSCESGHLMSALILFTQNGRNPTKSTLLSSGYSCYGTRNVALTI